MIKWITMHEWAGVQHPGEEQGHSSWKTLDERGREYERQLDEIRDRLPPDLLQADQHLHDAELLEVCCRSAVHELQLTVQTYDGKSERWLFQGVSEHRIINHRVELSGPPGFGHLGYSEIEIAEGGFSIAILCSSGIEIVVVATGFHLIPD